METWGSHALVSIGCLDIANSRNMMPEHGNFWGEKYLEFCILSQVSCRYTPLAKLNQK